MPEKRSPASFSEQVIAVVIDREGVRLLAPLNEVDTGTLRGCSAEDPADWNDIALVWPRYRFDAENCEFADGLPIRELALDAAREATASASAWLVLDLVGKRLVTGGRVPPLRLRGTPRREGDPESEVTVLPPWWELCEHNDLSVFDRSRVPDAVPDPHRELLWGSAMPQFLAERMVQVVRRGEEWIGKDWEGEPCGRHEWTCAVHRDWLMTPRHDLGGGIPRECLHIAKDWISDLADGQQFRVVAGQDPVPIPTELSTYANAPLGRHEVILYFDACRETIGAGWRWLIEHKQRLDEPALEQDLAAAMERFLLQWLSEPFEGGPSPSEVIHCERIRIPLVSRDEGHLIDCDCPICEMLATGMFGPSFIQFDGHQLELDDEFAFSLWATPEEWEREQAEWAEFNARMKSEMKEAKAAPPQGLSGDGELESVWKNTMISDEGIPGDTYGHLGLAFLVAEMGTALRDAGGAQHEIDELNGAFRNFRETITTEAHPAAVQAFKRTLETLCNKHGRLVSHSADLQSRIDEQLRKV